jgi:hypothetical protein
MMMCWQRFAILSSKAAGRNRLKQARTQAPHSSPEPKPRIQPPSEWEKSKKKGPPTQLAALFVILIYGL